MRTIIDLPEPLAQRLKSYGQTAHLSQAEVVRRALTAFLGADTSVPDQAFGLWRQRSQDALATVDALRNEWA